SLLARQERESNRMSALLRQGYASESIADREGAEAAAQAAKTEADRARRDAAEHAVEAASVALDGVALLEREERVLAAKVDVARARLAAADADVEAAQLRAPEDAFVAEVVAGPGSSVRVGQPVAQLWLIDRAWVEAWVPEDALGEITAGTSADVSLAAYGGDLLPRQVRAVGIPNPTRPPVEHTPPSAPL